MLTTRRRTKGALQFSFPAPGLACSLTLTPRLLARAAAITPVLRPSLSWASISKEQECHTGQCKSKFGFVDRQAPLRQRSASLAAARKEPAGSAKGDEAARTFEAQKLRAHS